MVLVSHRVWYKDQASRTIFRPYRNSTKREFPLTQATKVNHLCARIRSSVCMIQV
uniref:Ovule protein n=1 Tax=Ascaris lumbricoides TaxID=6252 RepID=A0A0M3IS74_ASCLU